jgi:putative ABC transport system substrate-binding protein
MGTAGVAHAAGRRPRSRWLVPAVALLALVAPLAAGAQAPSGKVHRIAILAFPSVPNPQTTAGIEAFRRGLRELGWVEGRNIVIELRATERERLDEAAARIVSERFDLIVTTAITPALAAKKATATIPIVVINAGDPVGIGLVASLARPGGNVTGLSSGAYELRGKRLALLKELVPRLGRVAALYPEAAASLPFIVQWVKDNESAARALGLTLKPIAVKEPFDWEATVAAAKRDGVRALALWESPRFTARAPEIAAAALRHRLPTVFGNRAYVEAGGLMAYGASIDELWRRAPAYVDKILRGTKPADLPIEQPTKFELVINAKTAKALGLTIPPVLRLQATEVID